MSLFVDTDHANIIELRNIRQTYDGGKSYIIDGLDFLVEDKPAQGQFIVILGASGSGKSTILRYIAGLQQPSAGDITIHGQPIEQAARVGMVFQQYSSFPWMTVLENVALAPQYQGESLAQRNERAMDMIRLVGLDGHEHKFAQYPTLSGGQLQRVAIARSLLANSEILLMDEPFGALDVSTRLQMQDLLTRIWLELHPTVIFVTHDISEAVYLGDDIYIMKPAPSHFVRHIHVDLPFNRSHETKRDPRFTELVRQVEDEMIRISQMQ